MFRRRRLVPIGDREKEAMYNRSDYRQLRPSIDDRQRTNVLEWLRWICTKLQWHFQAETFHLATDFFDRFISSQLDPNSIATSDLPLIGITSMYIAVKVVERRPSFSWSEKFSKLTDANKNDICVMEKRILNALDWEMSSKTPIHFLDNFIQETPALSVLKE